VRPIENLIAASTAFDNQWRGHPEEMTRYPRDGISQRGQVCQWIQIGGRQKPAPEHLRRDDVEPEVNKREPERDPRNRMPRVVWPGEQGSVCLLCVLAICEIHARLRQNSPALEHWES
jgi:hypothetical protein